MQTDEQKEWEIERRSQDRIAAAINNLPQLVEQAAERAVRRVLSDSKVHVCVDWEEGYKELERHASTSMAQAIGRRLLNWLIAAALAAAIAWVALTGKLK